jgi:PAS domain S-box-containing protein
VLKVVYACLVAIVQERLGWRAAREAAALRRSQEHLARVLRISGIGSVERDLRTDRVEWSVEACQIFGLEPDAIKQTREFFYSLVHPDDRDKVRTDADQSNSGISSEPLEYRIVRPDGEVRVVYRENDTVLDEAGWPIARFSVFKDITETHAAQERERELQRQLLHSQKLEALGTLAGGVAHDLNNTLVPILALSKMAVEALPEGSALRDDILTIFRASERARDLVKQILAFSRRQEAAKQHVDLARVTRDALQMLRATLPTTIQIADQILEVPRVLGDPGEMHQVIINLVTNAGHAIGSNFGKITVRLWGAAEREPSLAGKAGSVVCLSVGDTGCGMDQATVDRIFEPFFTTKSVGEGTGLGLSVVHGIVTRHGGRIEVRSSLGEGSEFTVVLPAVGRPQTTADFETAAAA